MSYREFRADFAKAAWDCLLNHGVIDSNGEHQTLKPEDMARLAVAYGDALIAELERTDRGEHSIATAPEPPAPALPRLNMGWKWAPADGTHVITSLDKWLHDDGSFYNASSLGNRCYMANSLATPDWHNPENIESPGEGWRFLVKGEHAHPGDEYFIEGSQKWAVNKDPDAFESEEWTHRTTRPLPPVLADEKEAQS